MEADGSDERTEEFVRVVETLSVDFQKLRPQLVGPRRLALHATSVLGRCQHDGPELHGQRGVNSPRLKVEAGLRERSSRRMKS